MKNLNYFIRESKKVWSSNKLSNIFSMLSIGLILFILTLILSGWWLTNEVMKLIQGEAEISVYYEQHLNITDPTIMMNEIEQISGVKSVRLVSEQEAYETMQTILGKEATILEVLDNNPFTAYIEVKIELSESEVILEQLKNINNIEYIRDNREVLERLKSISNILSILGAFLVVAVSISTLVITSHIIRQGIYNNRAYINTLKLLGAPNIFIALPYLLEGLFLTIIGGAIAFLIIRIIISQFYIQMTGPLPLIPLPPKQVLEVNMLLFIFIISSGLGILGSWFGFLSTKNQ